MFISLANLWYSAAITPPESCRHYAHKEISAVYEQIIHRCHKSVPCTESQLIKLICVQYMPICFVIYVRHQRIQANHMKRPEKITVHAKKRQHPICMCGFLQRRQPFAQQRRRHGKIGIGMLKQHPRTRPRNGIGKEHSHPCQYGEAGQYPIFLLIRFCYLLFLKEYEERKQKAADIIDERKPPAPAGYIAQY